MSDGSDIEAFDERIAFLAVTVDDIIYGSRVSLLVYSNVDNLSFLALGLALFSLADK